jgi:UDP-N-acetylmuramoyl-tripeptide--D-alanyl-D-alanine ligase
MKIEELHKLFLSSTGACTDTRKLTDNQLFFALKGGNFNGNAYAKQALEQGASFAIIDEVEYEVKGHTILVDNVLVCLQELAKFHRLHLKTPIIAITGSNGKTTTKELLHRVLLSKYNCYATKGNLNNHIGVPLTLLSMDESTEFGVVEMGANHMFEIKKLCEIAEPNFGIITNIGKAHLEGFGSVENIKKTKKELYDYLADHSGKAFYNSRNKILTDIIEQMKMDLISFAGDESKVKGEVLSGEQFLCVRLNINNTVLNINTQLVGAYNLENILAAASIGEYFNVSNENIKKALEEYTPANNRSQFIKSNTNNIYLDAYNANPTSVELSLKNFVSLNKPNSCIILGDMLELGKDSIKEHKKILHLIDRYSFGKIILVGNIYNSLQVKENIFQFENVNDLKEWFLKNEITNSSILIKGSRGIQLETIVEYL